MPAFSDFNEPSGVQREREKEADWGPAPARDTPLVAFSLPSRRKFFFSQAGRGAWTRLEVHKN